MINCSTLTTYGDLSSVHDIYEIEGHKNSAPNAIENNIDSQGLISS